MRIYLLVVTAAIFLSACADDQHATAPASRSGLSSRSASGGAAPSGQGIRVPEAKPTDQVGFTNVFSVAGPGVSFNTGTGPTTLTATCPAGSRAIGGGYEVINYPVSRSLSITKSGLNAANGWSVTLWMFDAASPPANVNVTANCVE